MKFERLQLGHVLNYFIDKQFYWEMKFEYKPNIVVSPFVTIYARHRVFVILNANEA